MIDVFIHTLRVLEACPREKIIRLAALFHDIGKPHCITEGEDGERHFYRHDEVGEEIAEQAMRRLKFSLWDIAEVCFLIKNHMRDMNLTPKAARKLIKDLGPRLEEWKQLKKADLLGGKHTPERVEERWTEFLSILEKANEVKEDNNFLKLNVNGSDIINLGFKEGPVIGQILNQLNDIILENPELNTKEILLEKVKELSLK